jgi:hypothetical protein
MQCTKNPSFDHFVGAGVDSASAVSTHFKFDICREAETPDRLLSRPLLGGMAKKMLAEGRDYRCKSYEALE